jgi:hypothetical protein
MASEDFADMFHVIPGTYSPGYQSDDEIFTPGAALLARRGAASPSTEFLTAEVSERQQSLVVLPERLSAAKFRAAFSKTSRRPYPENKSSTK